MHFCLGSFEDAQIFNALDAYDDTNAHMYMNPGCHITLLYVNSRRENAHGRRRSIATLMLMARGAESRLWVNTKPLQCVLHARKARCARAAGQTCSRLPAPVHVASLSRARCSEPPDVCVGRSDIDAITFKCISVIFTLLHIVIEQSAPASPIPHRNRT